MLNEFNEFDGDETSLIAQALKNPGDSKVLSNLRFLGWSDEQLQGLLKDVEILRG